MKRAPWIALAALASLALSAAPAHAEDQPTNPSAFTYAGNGFLMGSLVGLSAGYLVAREGGFESDDWKALVYGGGIGALAGGGLGLTLGIVDMARETPGFGSYVLRDSMYGAGFGALAGAIAGGLAAVSTKEPEHIGLGAAIGTMVGTAGGIALGIVEGSRAGHGGRRAQRPSLAVTLGAAEGRDGAPMWMPALAGRY
jgi:hypothetical protein